MMSKELLFLYHQRVHDSMVNILLFQRMELLMKIDRFECISAGDYPDNVLRVGNS